MRRGCQVLGLKRQFPPQIVCIQLFINPHCVVYCLNLSVCGCFIAMVTDTRRAFIDNRYSDVSVVWVRNQQLTMRLLISYVSVIWVQIGGLLIGR